MARFCREADLPAAPGEPHARMSPPRCERLLENQGGEPAARLREEMQDVMMDGVGIFRDGPGMETALGEGAGAKERYQSVMVMDKGKRSTPTCWRRGSSETCWTWRRSPR